MATQPKNQVNCINFREVLGLYSLHSQWLLKWFSRTPFFNTSPRNVVPAGTFKKSLHFISSALLNLDPRAFSLTESFEYRRARSGKYIALGSRLVHYYQFLGIRFGQKMLNKSSWEEGLKVKKEWPDHSMVLGPSQVV